jgi:cellobiose-specific phosphotransferase system component IIB
LAKGEKKEEGAETGAAASPTTTTTTAVSQVDNGPQIAALAEQVKELKETINILISQIQMLRSDLKKGKCISE